MLRYARARGMAWGTMDTLPDVIGLALYRDGHVGYAVGGGYALAGYLRYAPSAEALGRRGVGLLWR